MSVFVRSTCNYVVKASSIVELLSAIYIREGTIELVILANGRNLRDDVTIQSIASVDVHVRLPGGKVHGKLNQAGRIKQMTPFVEKTLKRKPKTGRARQKMKFNKKFRAPASHGSQRLRLKR
eukprot:maker-scaffold397_size184017-snap-gene-0.39 protein:Tk01042 transcript:maker-scaffold397_size184017-snap-gene-0.39-mRNA-1 annotation:"hypothetical protein EDEG_01357"